MEKKAILVASFGTTKDTAREKNIGPVEEAICEAYPDFAVRRAFTSNMVIRSLAKRGLAVDTVEQALERLKQEGYEQVFVLPTHLLPGEEYEKLLAQTVLYRSSFAELSVAKPLLYDTEDLKVAAGIVRSRYPVEKGEALLLMGHGTAHFANCVYPAMNYVLKHHGARHAFVACVEGYPELEDALQDIKADGYERITLVPLMLVAGDHALNDMAGDAEDSWKNRCEEAGFQTRCCLTGLGAWEEIHEIYRKHLEICMDAVRR